MNNDNPTFIGANATWAHVFGVGPETEFYTDAAGVVYYMDSNGIDYTVAGTLQELSAALAPGGSAASSGLPPTTPVTGINTPSPLLWVGAAAVLYLATR